MQNESSKPDINASEFDYISQFVETEAGIVLDKGKEYLAARNLESVCRTEGIDSIKELVWKLKNDKYGKLKIKVIESMTINETLFFRDKYPFDDLQKHVLPRLAEANEKKRAFNIWSASCSTGQEPYSLALLIRQHFPQLRNWAIELMATDIDKEVVSRAEAGTYSLMEVNRGLPAPLRDKFMTQENRSWQFKPEIKSLITFKTVNLIEAWPFKNKFDLVLLRNTLIYFKPEVKRMILKKIHRFISKDGYLLLSAADIFNETEVPFRQEVIGKSVFYRPL